MSCPRAFIASVTTACSPTPAARPTSPPPVSCCISRPAGLAPAAALITAVHDPPLCAGIAVPRCSSTRSSHAPNRSVPPRLHRSRHEHPPLTRQIFPVGASSNQADTIAHAHCTGYRAFLYRGGAGFSDTGISNGMDAPAWRGIKCAKVEVSSDYLNQQERPRLTLRKLGSIWQRMFFKCTARRARQGCAAQAIEAPAGDSLFHAAAAVPDWDGGLRWCAFLGPQAHCTWAHS